MLCHLDVVVAGTTDKIACRDMIHRSETMDMLVMVRVQNLITQDIQNGPLRYVMVPGKGLGTNSGILLQVYVQRCEFPGRDSVLAVVPFQVISERNSLKSRLKGLSLIGMRLQIQCCCRKTVSVRSSIPEDHVSLFPQCSVP